MPNKKGRKWYNNGKIEGCYENCSEGFIPGRLPISEETRLKHSINNGMKNISKEEMIKRNNKISETKQNKSEEEKIIYSKHLSEAKKGKPRTTPVWNKGKKGVQVAWNKGKSGYMTEEQKKNMTKQEIFEMCRSIDFPQTTLNDVSLITNFNNLKNAYAFGNSCTQLLQHFHPSIWKANIKNHLSPFEAWYDDTCLMKSIDNRLKYKGENLSPRDIRSGFSIAKIAPKVSIFRPALARYIIKVYLDEFDEIFDPCSGYSGRLLGAMSLNKKYIGQDINPVTVKESNNLINYFKFFDLNKCEVSCKNSICTKGKYQCLFTCPPYSDKENWNQSIENLSCDEWIDICLKNYKCKKYVFVVDKTEKYKNYIVDKIPNSSHLNTNYEYIILIDKSIK